MARDPVVRGEWTIASDISAIDGVVGEVIALCQQEGLPSRACRLNVSVALTEALSNAIICGNKCDSTRSVRARMALDRTTLILEVTDEGEGFDAAAAMFSPEDSDWLEREDGRGLFLMRSLMDRVELHRPTDGRAGHTVRLVLNRT